MHCPQHLQSMFLILKTIGASWNNASLIGTQAETAYSYFYGFVIGKSVKTIKKNPSYFASSGFVI